MDMTGREVWTVIHGMVFGFIFLLGFSGALYAVYAMRPEWLSAECMNRTINLTKAFV